MTYRVVIEARAQKALGALDRPDRARISKAILRLADDPFTAADVKALQGGGYRLRVGDYRVLYEVDSGVLVIVVVKVGHRREVYRTT